MACSPLERRCEDLLKSRKLKGDAVMKEIADPTFDEFAATLWGRETETESIKMALQILPIDKSVVHYFYGISGVGKSKLCNYTIRYIQTQLQAPHATVHIDMSSELTEQQIIQHLYQELSAQMEISFPRYEAASAYLFDESNDPIYKITPPESASSVLSSAVNVAAKLGSIALGLTISPDSGCLDELVKELASETVKQFLKWAGSTIITQSRKYMTEKKQSELKQFFHDLNLCSPGEVRRKLSLYFMEDLEGSLASIRTMTEAKDFRLVITVDAFEKRQHTASFEHFFQRLLECTRETTWFLFGTEISIPQQNAHSVILQNYPVEPFDTDRLGEYLEQQGITTPEIRDRIVTYSNGLPAAVQILLDGYRRNGDQLDEAAQLESYDALFDQYFIHHLTLEEQRLFSHLALFDNWNWDIFSAIFPYGDRRQEVFGSVINRSSLVVQSPTSTDEGEQYCLVDIVRKTLLAKLESNHNALMDAYRVKYNYEKGVADHYLDELKRNIIVDQKLNEQLKVHCTSAFRFGLESYSSKEEFEEISLWCTNAQQALSKRGLYRLKADLTKLYLDIVKAKDDFRYDTEDDREKRFRFQNTRDRVWALRYASPGSDTNTDLAGQYYAELLSKFGLNSPNIPFAAYLWGLTFYDAGDYVTARWLLEQSINLDTDVHPYDHAELNSSIPTVVHNVLGCLKMDLGQFPEAERDFLEAQRTRPDTDIYGKKKTYENLSRLYFRWAQAIGRENPLSNKISRYLDLSQKNIDKFYNLLNSGRSDSITDRYNVITHKIMLAVARDRLVGNPGAPMYDYINSLEDTVCDLQENAVAPAKLIFSVNHNIALIYALQRDYSEAQRKISNQIETAKKIYPTWLNSNARKNKPAIRDLLSNSRAVKRYVDDQQRAFNPYDFFLQF